MPYSCPNQDKPSGHIEPVLNKDFTRSSVQSMGSVETGVPSRKPLPAKGSVSSRNNGTDRHSAGQDSYNIGGAYGVRDDRSRRANPPRAPQPNYGFAPSSGLLKFYGPAPGFSPPSSYQKQHQLQNGGSVLHKSKERICNGNSSFDSGNKSIKKGDYQGSNKLTHGPAGNKRNDSVSSASSPSRENYNKPEFQRRVLNGGNMAHKSKDNICNGNAGIDSRDKSTRNNDCAGSNELTRCPADNKRNDSVCSVSSPSSACNLRDKYYKPEFQHRVLNGGSMAHRPNDSICNGNVGIGSRNESTRNGDCAGSDELTRCPTDDERNNSVCSVSSPSSACNLRDKYYKPEFQRRVFNGGSMAHRPNDSIWNGNAGIGSRNESTRNDDCARSDELIRGPRVNKKNDSLCSLSSMPPCGSIRGDYNVAEFQIEYDCAKFYVIKSFSEDDVQKCIKYNVWASTPFGNKKLDAAFHDVRVKVEESVNCPIFLFFSVNTSGQFVGLAEMIGRVDFNKTMDFWQVDKWSGFFPVKWHIIKDIPNSQLRHILLKNNENKPVTFTRDTHEIELNEGLQMLKIFKNYQAKSSLLDDFEFYENREKAKYAKKSENPAAHRTNV